MGKNASLTSLKDSCDPTEHLAIARCSFRHEVLASIATDVDCPESLSNQGLDFGCPLLTTTGHPSRPFHKSDLLWTQDPQPAIGGNPHRPERL